MSRLAAACQHAGTRLAASTIVSDGYRRASAMPKARITAIFAAAIDFKFSGRRHWYYRCFTPINALSYHMVVSTHYAIYTGIAKAKIRFLYDTFFD